MRIFCSVAITLITGAAWFFFFRNYIFVNLTFVLMFTMMILNTYGWIEKPSCLIPQVHGMMGHLREVPHLLVPLEDHRHSVATIKEALVTLTSKYHHHHHSFKSGYLWFLKGWHILAWYCVSYVYHGCTLNAKKISETLFPIMYIVIYPKPDLYGKRESIDY